MKIGILTLLISDNYGGILQNYALQTILTNMGHDVITVQRYPGILKGDIFYSLIKKKIIIKQNIRISLDNFIRFFKKKPLLAWTWERRKLFRILNDDILSFNTKHLKLTDIYYSPKAMLKDYYKNKYEAYIVGSDQVWRPMYNNHTLVEMYLSFLPENLKVKRIAYAASFGSSDWEYSKS